MNAELRRTAKNSFEKYFIEPIFFKLVTTKRSKSYVDQNHIIKLKIFHRTFISNKNEKMI